MSDVEIEAAENRAVTELERRLRPIVTIQDPRAFAQRFIADMRSEGWRPPLRPSPGWKHDATQAGAAPNQDWKAARAALGMDGGAPDAA
ncbi:hypothetical protein ACGFNU_21540 [Spirillospora sp. NPDC048911]|uniref:hypothetical protein n=1 Tax=Spirillospora sp. NPDC048911 TaxID=3364527 RepID=UPI00370F9DF8